MGHLNHGVVFRQIDKRHRPLTKTSVRNFFHRQQFNIVVNSIGHDASVKQIDLRSLAFQDLQPQA